MSLFPSLSITATTLWVVPRSMPMIFSPSARPTPFQVSTTGTQDSLNEVFNQFATTRDNERPSTAFVPQPLAPHQLQRVSDAAKSQGFSNRSERW